MKKQLMFTIFMAIFCLPVFANNITVSNPTLTNGSAADGYGNEEDGTDEVALTWFGVPRKAFEASITII